MSEVLRDLRVFEVRMQFKPDRQTHVDQAFSMKVNLTPPLTL